MELKNKTLGEMTRPELRAMADRLRLEREIEDQICNYIIRSSKDWDGSQERPKINTKTKISEMYPNNEKFAQKTISELTDEELRILGGRLRLEDDITYAINSLRYNSGENNPNEYNDYGARPNVDNNTPIKNLYHSGIFGMKWGVRRYQNEDGTLTDAGKRRYGSDYQEKLEFENKDGKITVAGSKYYDDVSGALKNVEGTIKNASALIPTPKKTKRINEHDYSKMTNEELQNKINRWNLEEAYGRLSGDTKMVRSGGDWAREVLQTTGAAVGVVGGALGIYVALKHL